MVIQWCGVAAPQCPVNNCYRMMTADGAGGSLPRAADAKPCRANQGEICQGVDQPISLHRAPCAKGLPGRANRDCISAIPPMIHPAGQAVHDIAVLRQDTLSKLRITSSRRTRNAKAPPIRAPSSRSSRQSETQFKRLTAANASNTESAPTELILPRRFDRHTGFAHPKHWRCIPP